MRASAQPVAVITTLLPSQHQRQKEQGCWHVHGATLSSFTTISLNPPLVAFSLQTPSRLADALLSPTAQSSSSSATDHQEAKGPHFVVNILSKGQVTEAGGFSKPGLAPFTLASKWTRRLASTGKGTDSDEHPLSVAPFHPSQHAMNASGVAVPVLSSSLGSLACSTVSRLALNQFTNIGEEDKSRDGGGGGGGSELFVARVHGVEQGLESANDGEERLPMVYWDQTFKSVER